MKEYIMLSRIFPGEFIKKDNYKYFLPGNIFMSKDITLDFAIQKSLERATLELGRFSAKFKDIPSSKLFLQSYLNRESASSTRIEGTQADIADSFKEEQDTLPESRIDWQELQQYIRACSFAQDKLKEIGLTQRCIKEAHKILLQQSRGEDKLPGEYRKTQNWIGGRNITDASFIPPSHEVVSDAMDNLEQFIHDDNIPMPQLIKIALIHYQFETIHPFLDGNGRMGRMLIPLYLLANKILPDPILYISDFFEEHRDSYYSKMNEARKSKEGVVKWIEFFLQAVYTTSLDGIDTTDEIVALYNGLKEKIRSKNSARLLDLIFGNPIVSAKAIQKKLAISPVLAQNLLANFNKLDILTEVTGNKRNRLFVFEEYLSILRK